MSLHGELAGGAAQRRRERRLRSWLRHERQTVAMVLAEACHHSSGSFPPTLKERRMASQDAYDALQGQNTARTVGTRPAPLAEAAGPQVRAATVGYVAAAGAPLLSVPLLAGGDGLGNTSVRWLLKVALKKKKEEEEERKVQERKERVMRDIHRKIHANEEVSEAEWAAWRAWHGIGSSSSGGQKRKRKKRRKRRKRKLPRSPRPLVRAAFVDDSGSGTHVMLGFPGDVSPRAVFLRSRQAQMRCIMASLDQKDSYVMAGFTGCDAPRAVFLSVAIPQVQFL